MGLWGLSLLPSPHSGKHVSKTGCLWAGGLSAEPPAPQALTCGQGQAEGRPVKLVQEVHTVIAAGPQRVAVRVRQVHQQRGAQARLGGQAPRLLWPQPGATRGGGGPAQGSPVGGPRLRLKGHPWGDPGSGLLHWPPLACPVFSDEVLGPSL